jgi:peptide/nickel transport system permease protein
MTTTANHPDPLPPDPAPARPATESSPGPLALLWARPVSAVCLVVVGLYILAGLLSFYPAFDRLADTALPAITLPNADPITEYAPPSFHHFPDLLLGTDIQNRPVLYRTLWGARTALHLTAIVSIITLTIGITLGVVAGYFGGWIDEGVNWLVATFSSVPDILLIISLGFVLKSFAISDLNVIILALGLTGWVGICRLIRGEVLKLRSLDYVAAAKAIGLPEWRILLRHIVPNTLHLVIVTFTLGAVGYVQAEVALTFLGLGVSEKPSWGRMIDDAKLELLRGVWWQFAAATLAIGILSLALSLLGDALRDVLDPKTRSRR